MVKDANFFGSGGGGGGGDSVRVVLLTTLFTECVNPREAVLTEWPRDGAGEEAAIEIASTDSEMRSNGSIGVCLRMVGLDS